VSGPAGGRGGLLRAARWALFAVVAAWTLLPIYYMLMLAFTPWDDLFQPVYWVRRPTLDNFRFVVFQKDNFVRFFWQWLSNSLVISGVTMALTLVVSALGSFALGRIRFGLGRLVSGMTLFTYIIPASFLSIPFFKIMADFELIDTYWAVILSMTTFAAPYALWVLWDYAKTIPPEIDESAAIDGAGVWTIFLRMYLPLMAPPLIAIGTYAFFFAWNEYLYAVMLLHSDDRITLPVAMGRFLVTDDAPWNLLMAVATLYALPPVVFYYVFRRYLTHGLVSGAVQGT
jgi:multiple sugar transport system permease protein